MVDAAFISGFPVIAGCLMARNHDVFGWTGIDSFDSVFSAVVHLARLVYILMADLVLSRLDVDLALSGLGLMREARPYAGTV